MKKDVYPWLWIGLIGYLGFIFALNATFTVQAQGGDTPEFTSFVVESGGKLSARLALLAQPTISSQDAETQAKILSLPVAGPGSLLKNSQGELLVYIRLTDTTEANLKAITEAGATLIHIAPAYRVVTAYLPVDRLLAVAAVEAVENIQEELTPSTTGSIFEQPFNNGSISALPYAQAGCPTATTSTGYSQLKVDQISPPLDGAAVTVGLLSDSFAQVLSPTQSLSDDIKSGDLPGSENPCGYTQTIKIIADYAGSKSVKDEGRAMAQIVHDLAPGAKIVFNTAFQGIFMYAGAVRQLRDGSGSDGGGADIIVDDIFYEQQPFFQDGPVAVAVHDVVTNGALYLTAAGNAHLEDAANNAISAYQASAYRSTTCPQAFIDFNLTDCHDFDPGPASDPTMELTLEPNGRLAVNFQWAEPWYGVQTDLNIYLVNGAGQIVKGSQDSNTGVNGTQKPWEFFSYQNKTGANENTQLVIVRAAGSGAPPLKYILPEGTTSGLIAGEYMAANSTDTFGATIFGQRGAKEAITIAAVPYNDDNTVRPSSSRGFSTYYYGPVVNTTPAAPLPAPETRLKPDVAATNDVCNTFFGSFDASAGCYRFAGTSAAAPHAAAVAALMKQKANQLGLSLRQSDTEFILETTAAPIANGSPQASGAGLIDAAAAVELVDQTKVLYLPLIFKPSAFLFHH